MSFRYTESVLSLSTLPSESPLMVRLRLAFASVVALLATAFGTTLPSSADDAAKAPMGVKRILLVTHSGGFVHGSVGTAEDVLKERAEKLGYEVTCWRFTNDPTARVRAKGKKKDDPEIEQSALEAYNAKFRGPAGRGVELEHCGRINAETLKKFDCVFFFTTGDPVNAEELKDLLAWIKAGGAFVGTHCATDTLYSQPTYGDMIGGYFVGHPPGLQKIKVQVEDAKHPAAVGFEPDSMYEDEIYVMSDKPYSRDKLHIIFSAGAFDPTGKLNRKDKDYAVSWCRVYGEGKVFYTSFGHQPKVWKDAKFQSHLFGGIDWALGRKPGDATPTGKK